MEERILIIEDRAPIGLLLRKYLNEELARLITLPRELAGAENPLTGYKFKHANDEPGQGQLQHLGEAPRAERRADLGRLKGEEEIDLAVLPRAHLFPIGQLEQLESLCELYDSGFGCTPDDPDDARIKGLWNFVERHGGAADILIVDLATSTAQSTKMMAAHADRTSIDLMARSDSKDPRPTLRGLTGFKMLRLFSKAGIPVIVTAFWPNPFVANHCLVNGAFAYVEKPLLSADLYARISSNGKAPDEHDDDADGREISWQEFDLKAKLGKDREIVVIQRYLTAVAAEVMKALALLLVTSYD